MLKLEESRVGSARVDEDFLVIGCDDWFTVIMLGNCNFILMTELFGLYMLEITKLI